MNIAPDYTLDCCGLMCPQPVLKTKKLLSNVDAGKKVLVICTDQMASVDIPHFVSTSGNILRHKEIESDRLLFLIEKT